MQTSRDDRSVVVLPGATAPPGPAALLALLAEVTDVGLLCGPDGRVRYATDALTACLGLDPAEVVGRDCLQLVHPGDRAGALRSLDSLVRAGVGRRAAFELRLRHLDGSWRWVQGTAVNRLSDPAVDAVVVTLSDVSSRRAAEVALDELAGTDGMTGLPDRATLVSTLEAAHAAGRGDRAAVLVLDLDGLPDVDEAHGRAAEEQVLVTVASRLVRLVDAHGFVARLAGGRFAVLLGDADQHRCAAVAHELLAAARQPVRLGDLAVEVTASVGAAVGPAPDGGALLTAAEAALRRAATTPSRVWLARRRELPAAHRRQELVDDLRRGMRAGELVVHYQPIVRLDDGSPVSAEALVRWAHPSKGLLSPTAFLGAAEDSGAVVELGRRVLLEACAAAATWPEVLGRRRLPVSVNVSPRQLVHGDLVAVVDEALEVTGLPPSALVLEITETAVLGDLQQVVTVLRRLRDRGVGIAADDFGTGYSTLAHAKQLPLTAVKIDRSFVGGLGRDAGDAAIVASLLSLAAALDLECVAEGVETEQQRLVLRTLGCDRAQGFLFCRPIDAAALAARFAEPVSDEVTARGALARARQLRADGASLTTVAAALNSEGRTTSAGRRWSARSVALLLGATR
ncbi:MAG TPA: EAL domain-containing protein [Mycobacteriales bacterium]|nr:EAL domain-containing protein [Mycobacteriales bacterium]